MNEQVLYDIGYQKHAETVTRAEANMARAAIVAHTDRQPIRHPLAAGLVGVAGRLQPGLRCELTQPRRPATA